MAVCDADYRFHYVDVGTPGKWSDGGVFNRCAMGVSLTEGVMGIPNPSEVEGMYLRSFLV